MKTKIQGLVFFLAISPAILLMSCSKDRIIPAGTDLTPVAAGAIVDLGAVSGEVHHMSVSLSGVALAMPGSTMDNTVVSDLNIELFTESDGIIKNGVYTFSDSGDIVPFTFKSASLNTPEQSGIVLSNGTITVDRNGTTYSITFDGIVPGGDPISGIFEGRLNYSDGIAPY